MVKAWALVLLLPSLVLAAPEVPVIDRPVVDEVGLLSAADTETVARELVALRDTKGAQMAVLLVDTTSGEPIEDYSIRTARQWRGGQGGANNGLLFVLAVKDRRMRLEVGYGMEEFLPDDAVRRLLDAQLPLMRQKDFSGALVRIIQGVGERLPASGNSASHPTPGTRSVSSSPLKPEEENFVEGVLLGVLLFPACAFVMRSRPSTTLGRVIVAVLCVGLLSTLVSAILGLTKGDAPLLIRSILILVMGAGLFFLGRHLMMNTRQMWLGACLMVGTLLGLLLCLGEPLEATFLSVLFFTLFSTLAVMLSSVLKLGNLVIGPWMVVFGGFALFREWVWPQGARSYSSSSGAARNTSPADSSPAASSPDASPPDASSPASSWVAVSAASYDSSSSSSYDSSSSSSSSYDSSSSSSYDSSTSSSSSSDWSGGGGDFGGGGSSSSW